ncbi:MAG TPA: sugar ABC transporter substrate-binding protein [Spirochaetia bacterium]|nr:sugar ABC transporter substrate-binding protein [Spirochaetia bacterium]
MRIARMLLCAVVLSVLVAGSIVAGGQGEAAKSGKPFDGVSIRAVFPVHPWTDGVKKLLPEFADSTGMKVLIDEYGTDQMSNKIAVEFAAKSSSMDVLYVRPLNETKLFGKNNWTEDLSKYVKTDAAFDLPDFVDSTIQGLTYEGKLIGLPTTTERQILYYRKDVLAKAGVAVPKTLDELRQVAAKVNDPANGFYGMVSRGKKNILITQFSSYLHSFGGEFNEGDTAVLDTPEAIAAFKYYSDLLRNYGPPGIVNFSWPEAAALMAQGKVAMFTDADAIYLNVVAPDKSTVGDKIGFAVFPAGPAGSKPFNVCSGGVGMSSFSKQKDAAAAFLKWVAGKDVVMRLQVEGNSGARKSVWANPDSTKSWPADLVATINQSNQLGVGWDRPRVINVAEARDIISEPLLVGFEGGDVTAAVKATQAKFQALIDREKK